MGAYSLLPPTTVLRAESFRWHAESCALVHNLKWARRSHTLRRQQHRARHSLLQAISQPEAEEDPEPELLPEEDWTVPGGYQDSLSKNTKLGKALDEAVNELDTLGELERESLIKANALLKKLGYKGDITAPQIPPQVNREHQ